MMSWRATRLVCCAALACAACDEPNGESNDDGHVTEGGETGDPITCEAQLSEAACAATEPSEPGLLWCAWLSVQTFSDVDACQVASTESRCISIWDQGNGCSGPSCDQTNYYTRVGEAGTELFSWTPDSCGHEPFHDEGWRQCNWSSGGPMDPMSWSEGQVCDCACGSPPSGTEP
jgi:hypothetical protein